MSFCHDATLVGFDTFYVVGVSGRIVPSFTSFLWTITCGVSFGVAERTFDGFSLLGFAVHCGKDFRVNCLSVDQQLADAFNVQLNSPPFRVGVG